jgi:enoyl-CoA hydratase
MRVDYGLDYIDVQIDDAIAVVRIKDPNDEHFVERKHPMHRQLRDVWTHLAEDDAVRAAVLGGGHDHFFPAPRLPQMAALLTAHPEHVEAMQAEAKQIFVNIMEFPKPLVVAAFGSVIGMGPQIAFLADFLIASRDTTFVDTHVPVAIASGDGATVVWPLVMGLARARKHVLRGAPLSAVEADELGLVETLVDTRGEVLPAARALAADLAQLSPLAFRATKLALNQWLRLGVQISLEVVSALEVQTFASEDFRKLLEPYVQSDET